jgi:hypothetical protein
VIVLFFWIGLLEIQSVGYRKFAVQMIVEFHPNAKRFSAKQAMTFKGSADRKHAQLIE